MAAFNRGLALQGTGEVTGKGVLYSPGHGLTEFTVPMFDDFLRRTIAWPLEDF